MIKRRVAQSKPPATWRTAASSSEMLAMAKELMAIPAKSGEEEPVARYIIEKLKEAGADEDAISSDMAHRQTPLKGNTGNLIFKLPGTMRAPRRLLTAHMDTVPICVGCRPVRKGEFIRSANSATGLGADNRAGCTVLLHAAISILKYKLPHPPLTFCWFIQEEIGLHGARHLQKSKLGNPKLAFNWDGGAANKLTVGATGGYRMSIAVRGLASHAGGAPEMGVSAIAIAALAIADLQRNGWHGAVSKGNRYGTSNIGFIQGGEATNVVTDYVLLRAEARSHDRNFRQEIISQIETAFQRACKEIKNATGATGSVSIDGRLDYEAFRLADDDPSVSTADLAIRRAGREPFRAVTNGGLDANWLTQHGIPSVTLGCGQVSPHTVAEALDIEQFHDACRIGLLLATGTELADETR